MTVCAVKALLYMGEKIKFVLVISKFLDWFDITDLHAILGGGNQLSASLILHECIRELHEISLLFYPFMCNWYNNTIQNIIENIGLIQISSEW